MVKRLWVSDCRLPLSIRRIRQRNVEASAGVACRDGIVGQACHCKRAEDQKRPFLKMADLLAPSQAHDMQVAAAFMMVMRDAIGCFREDACFRLKGASIKQEEERRLAAFLLSALCVSVSPHPWFAAAPSSTAAMVHFVSTSHTAT